MSSIDPSATVVAEAPARIAPTHIMLDLESMGRGPQAAIVAIGAVCFSLVERSIVSEFYVVMDLKSSVTSGGTMCPETVMWWLEQCREAQDALLQPAMLIGGALERFTNWIDASTVNVAGEYGHRASVRVWGNGATFDNVIITSAYENCEMPRPWAFCHDRCYRTVVANAPTRRTYEGGVKHNALADARAQALHLINFMDGKEHA